MKKGLGKGLGALIPNYNDSPDFSAQSVNDSNTASTELKISDIEPNKDQPRKNFDTEQLQVLADSIALHGIIQPIAVKKLESGRYQIIAGERRWRAARLAGLKKVPVVVLEVDGSEVMELALIENLQRENLNPIEEAVAYKALMEEYNLTQEKISEKLGKSRPAIANTLRLIALSDDVKLLVSKGTLSGGHARCLVGISDENLQLDLAKKIIQDQLSVRQTEDLIKLVTTEKKPTSKNVKKDIYIEDIENRLTKKLGLKVQISAGTKKSKLEIDYYNNHDLEKILKILGLNI